MPGQNYIPLRQVRTTAGLRCALGLFIFRLAAFPACAAWTPDSLYLRAREELAAGSGSAAAALLDSALQLDPRHGPSLLARGRLYLGLGDLDRAREDFNRAAFHPDDSVRSAGHLGLGDLYRRLPHRNLRAAAEYRQALRADSLNLEALYALARTGFALEETHGYGIASKALTRLVVLDPLYRDAYSQWRRRFRDHTAEEYLAVGRRLDNCLAEHPDTGCWRLDLAADRFRLGQPDSALDRLTGAADPDCRPGAWHLLRARCLLDLGDTTGFESAYDRALEEARHSGDFSGLLREAEPIFSPRESEQWAALDSAGEMAAFFRAFWTERDPDPLTPHNERLVTHYSRLREAGQKYFLFFPHSRFQTSRDYNRLISPVSFLLDYDPGLFWDRCRWLSLDHRGLLFIRHGPPDRVTRQVTWADPMEIWYYGSVHFLFERKRGVGDFIYTPGVGRGQGDINRAMETESFEDPVPGFRQDYYAADFLAADGGTIQVEFYQSASLALPADSGNPLAAAAIFDTTWAPLARNETLASASLEPGDSLWVAVHGLTAAPGKYNYVVRMLAPQRRAVDRGCLLVEPIAADRLALSGVILGGALPEGVRGLHRRRGVELAPRPSRRFRRGESIQVYLEVYGVGTDWKGERSFRERVTVGRLREKPKEGRELVEVIERFLADSRARPRVSLTLTFDRTLPGPERTHAETFSLDTSSLAAGYYRLLIEVRDNSSGRRSRQESFFQITGQ